MLFASIPTKMPTVWGASAGGPYIRVVPVASQIGIQNGAASFTDGWPPLCFSPVAAGGSPPFGQDFNGLMNVVTAWLQWMQAGEAIPFYDATFSGLIGGYPQNAMLQKAGSPGFFWINLVDGNTSNPDTGGANWQAFPALNNPARVVTASTNFTLANTDFAVGLNRTSSPAATSITMPPAPLNGQEIEVADLADNFNLFPVTMVPNAGQMMVGTTKLTVNRQVGKFRFYTTGNLWSGKG